MSRNNTVDVLVFFSINNPIIRRRKKLLAVFTKIFSAHRAAHLVIPLKCMEKTHYYILMLRRKFLSGLRPCERRNQVFSGSLTTRYD